MPWGVASDKKKEPVAEPSASERDVLVFNINEVSNDTLDSTRYRTKIIHFGSLLYLRAYKKKFNLDSNWLYLANTTKLNCSH